MGSGRFRLRRIFQTRLKASSDWLWNELSATPAQKRRALLHPASVPGVGVGVVYGRWTSARPLELRGRWISNVCTVLQRVYLSLTSVGRREPRRRRWSCVRTLDKRTAVGVARPVDLQRLYRSPTRVPKSNVRGSARRPSLPLELRGRAVKPKLRTAPRVPKPALHATERRPPRHRDRHRSHWPDNHQATGRSQVGVRDHVTRFPPGNRQAVAARPTSPD